MTQALRKFVSAPETERCELCSLALSERHQHLIDPGTRQLICSCDGCATLFDTRGATRYRRVPRHARRLGELTLPDEAWERLLIPINLAFFYRSSRAGRIVALYPSPAGVTESQLELSDWNALASANPNLASLQEDVEALLVNRLKETRQHYIAPIDRCFELVGIVRKNWSGLSGGDAVWSEVSAFFSRLNEEALS